MEQTVQRLRFRIGGRGTVAETDGRIVTSPDGTVVLQVTYSTPEQPHVLLEVGPVDAEARLWPLFWKLCEYKSFVPHEYRATGARGLGEWQPVPGAPGTAGAGGDAPPTGAGSRRKK